MAKTKCLTLFDNVEAPQCCLWSNTCTNDPQDPRYHMCCAICRANGLNNAVACEDVCLDYAEGACKYLTTKEFLDQRMVNGFACLSGAKPTKK